MLATVWFVLAAPIAVANDDKSAPIAEREAVIDALTTKADPNDDDWTTEILADKAGKQLKKLGNVWAEAGDKRAEQSLFLFAEDAKIGDLRPDPHETKHIGNITVHRYGISPADRTASAGDVKKSLTELLKHFSDAKPIRTKFKTVGVREVDAKHFEIDVIYQAVGQHTDGRNVQHTGEWTLVWHKSEEGNLRITTLTQHRLDEVLMPLNQFVDCTRGVIADEAIWSPQLAHGCEYWFGRVDAVGEINFMGHNGIAVGDVNGDGLDDIYVAQGTGLPNKLLVQQPDGTVIDTAVQAGVAWLDDTKSVLLVDIDNDGDQDLLCAIGPTIVLCENDGSGEFRPRRGMRASTPASFYSLAAADYDGDGDLDIYGCRYVKLSYGVSVPVPFQDANNGPANHLLRNDGKRGFVDVTREVGLHINNARFSLAATWVDYDEDGDPDLYVTNDFGRNNLYRNDGGKFVDIAAEAGVEDQAAGMGASWSDIDLDGDLDLYVSNMFSSAGRRIAYQSRFLREGSSPVRSGVQRHSLGNSLFVNNGDGVFEDRSELAQVRLGRWAWGARFTDLNNDGYEDVVVPNGFLTNLYKDDL